MQEAKAGKGAEPQGRGRLKRQNHFARRKIYGDEKKVGFTYGQISDS